MTAQYPGDVGIWDNDSVLSSDVPTFAHALGAGGYEAVLCGRMHFNGTDPFHGFERRLYGDCDRYLSPEIRGQGRNRTNGQTKYAVEVAGYGRTGYQAYDATVTKRACEFIRTRGGHRRGAQDRPYCLVVGYVLPHNPLICSRPWFDHYASRLSPPPPLSAAEKERLHPAIRRWRERRGVDDLTPEQNQRALAAYYGLVSEMDGNVGRILEEIASTPGASDTAIIYCADHGDMAGEHGMWWKSCHYEGAASVPLIVSWPGCLAEGKTVDRVVSLIDIGPTVLDLAGCNPLPDVAGRSLAGFLAGDETVQNWPDQAWCEYIGAHGDQPSCMLRSGPWKLIYYSETGSAQLYHLREDPGEHVDRMDDPACQQTAADLLSKLHERWSAQGMLGGRARERRARQLIRRCGHPPIPHAVDNEDAPPGTNQFDFSQLPGWDEIRRRVDQTSKIADGASD
jgi:choline-sulfatase